MSKAPPRLAQWQDMVQRAILTGDTSDVLPFVPGNALTTRDVLFGVYQYAYAARLVGIVASDHEFLETYMGNEVFDAMARRFIAAHPSTTPNARWFADALPDFLARTEPYCGQPELSELARLERTLADAFDAPDATLLTLADLQRVPPEHWGELLVTPHPSTARLDQATNAFDIWSAMKSETPPPAVQRSAEPRRFLVWRNGTTATVRPLRDEEAMLWDESAKGVSFGRLCELAAVFDDPDTAALRAAQYLQTWLDSGALTSAGIAATAS